MSNAIFEFWSEAEVGADQFIHPRDQAVFNRIGDRPHFNLTTPPGPFFGPLKSAPIVLLYLSPGYGEDDEDPVINARLRAQVSALRRGHQPLPGPEEFPRRWKWWSSRTKVFGDWQHLMDRIAILNIGAYHSKEFLDAPLLAALPSSRASLSWAQDFLFPQAERGERIVVCMRAAHFWGLSVDSRHGSSLFAPPVTRGGHMLAGAAREEVVASVRQRLIIDARTSR